MGANFTGASLRDTSFCRADLTNAVFTGNFELVGTDFSNANLEGASFAYTIWLGGSLQGARVKSASFRHAELPGVDVSGTDFSAAWTDDSELKYQ